MPVAWEETTKLVFEFWKHRMGPSSPSSSCLTRACQMGCLEGGSHPRSTSGGRFSNEADWSGSPMAAFLCGDGHETGSGSFLG